MNMILTYTRLQLLSVFRNRSALFFTIIFPAILFLLFGHSDVHGTVQKAGSFISFCNYAVQTVYFLSLGMTISAQRSSTWTIYLRTLPAEPYVNMLAMIASKFLVALASLVLIVLINMFVFHSPLSWRFTGYIMFAALVGGIPMAFLGIALGYRINPGAARGVFVFVNLLLLFAGFSTPHTGSWIYLSDIVPTYQWMMISLSHLTGDSSVIPWLCMLGFAVLFYIFAEWSYAKRRDLRRS